jgi:membrane protein implicated in regulation of membrane protease activity
MVSIFQSVLAFFVRPPLKEPLHRSEGTIASVIEPGKIWQVWHRASYWYARSHKQANFRPGERVRVVEQQDLLLFIEPLETDDQ